MTPTRQQHQAAGGASLVHLSGPRRGLTERLFGDRVLLDSGTASAGRTGPDEGARLERRGASYLGVPMAHVVALLERVGHGVLTR